MQAAPALILIIRAVDKPVISEWAMSQTFSEKCAWRVARGPATDWMTMFIWAMVTVYNMWQFWSDASMSFLAQLLITFLHVLLWATLVYMAITFDGFRRLLRASESQIKELKRTGAAKETPGA